MGGRLSWCYLALVLCGLALHATSAGFSVAASSLQGPAAASTSTSSICNDLNSNYTVTSSPSLPGGVRIYTNESNASQIQNLTSMTHCQWNFYEDPTFFADYDSLCVYELLNALDDLAAHKCSLVFQKPVTYYYFMSVYDYENDTSAICYAGCMSTTSASTSLRRNLAHISSWFWMFSVTLVLYVAAAHSWSYEI